jgi:hypothetical protein
VPTTALSLCLYVTRPAAADPLTASRPAPRFESIHSSSAPRVAARSAAAGRVTSFTPIHPTPHPAARRPPSSLVRRTPPQAWRPPLVPAHSTDALQTPCQFPRPRFCGYGDASNWDRAEKLITGSKDRGKKWLQGGWKDEAEDFPHGPSSMRRRSHRRTGPHAFKKRFSKKGTCRDAAVVVADSQAITKRVAQQVRSDGSVLHCLAVSSYCFKIGRLTVPPVSRSSLASQRPKS